MAAPVVVSQADFAVKLLRQSANFSNAVVFSPLSITSALAAACLGAKGETKSQIHAALASGVDEEDFNSFVRNELKAVSKGGEGYDLNTATRLYVDKRLSLMEKFVFDIEANFTNELQTADFKQTDTLTKEINDWVEDKTNSKIKDLVKPDDLVNSSMVIANAIHFKGYWAEKFDASATRPQTFYISENETRQVDMMHINKNFDYFEDERFQVLGLPYKSEDLKMYFFLPVQKCGLEKVESSLTGQYLLELMKNTYSVEVNVSVPKVKLELKLELPKALKKLGIVNAFSGKAADFSGISETPLFLSNAVHKTFIEVNEEGTEAAAATGLIAARMCIMVPETFTADHPFIFAIAKGDVLLFIGRYV